MNIELILTVFIIPLVSTIGILLWHKLTGVCNRVDATKKEVKTLYDRFIAYEEMKAGVEIHCPLYKHIVQNK